MATLMRTINVKKIIISYSDFIQKHENTEHKKLVVKTCKVEDKRWFFLRWESHFDVLKVQADRTLDLQDMIDIWRGK